MSDQEKRDIWEKVKIIGELFSGVGIPLVLLIAGNWLSHSIHEGERKKRDTELAIEIVRQTPDTARDIPGLREWAIKVLVENLSLPAGAGPSLADKPLRSVSFTGSGRGGSAGPGGTICVDMGGYTACGSSVWVPDTPPSASPAPPK